MVRFFLCAGIIGLSWTAGYCYTSRWRRRCRYLKYMSEMFQSMQIQMQYRLDPLPVLFQRTAEKLRREENGCEALRQLFSEAAKKMADGRGDSADEIWGGTVMETLKETALKKEDMAELASLGGDLGSTEIQLQKKAMGHITEKLLFMEKEAQAECKKNTKLYRTLFTAGGIVIVILLI